MPSIVVLESSKDVSFRARNIRTLSLQARMSSTVPTNWLVNCLVGRWWTAGRLGNWSNLGIASSAYVFHVLMCFFVIWQILSGNKQFSWAFYKLYAMLSAREILH